MASLKNVWSIATHGYSAAHFATFPPALVEPCIQAGTSDKGACPHCGAPWARITKARLHKTPKGCNKNVQDERDEAADPNDAGSNRMKDGHVPGMVRVDETIDWKPTCDCPTHEPVPCTVLDPFGGAGTTALVAQRLARHAVLIEISEKYAEMAAERLRQDAPLIADVRLD